MIRPFNHGKHLPFLKEKESPVGREDTSDLGCPSETSFLLGIIYDIQSIFCRPMHERPHLQNVDICRIKILYLSIIFQQLLAWFFKHCVIENITELNESPTAAQCSQLLMSLSLNLPSASQFKTNSSSRAKWIGNGRQPAYHPFLHLPTERIQGLLYLQKHTTFKIEAQML